MNSNKSNKEDENEHKNNRAQDVITNTVNNTNNVTNPIMAKNDEINNTISKTTEKSDEIEKSYSLWDIYQIALSNHDQHQELSVNLSEILTCLEINNIPLLCPTNKHYFGISDEKTIKVHASEEKTLYLSNYQFDELLLMLRDNRDPEKLGYLICVHFDDQHDPQFLVIFNGFDEYVCKRDENDDLMYIKVPQEMSFIGNLRKNYE